MTASRAIHVLVFDGFADWEAAYALAELRRWGKRKIVVTGFTGRPVTSMGGVQVTPERMLSDIRASDVEMLILPGGDLWEGTYPRAKIEVLLKELLAAAVPIAAICGATLCLARAGLLDDRRHTSNMLSYLTDHAAEYQGAALYNAALAVNDRGVITASGLGAVEFARAIFNELSVFSAADEQLWFDMFKHGRIPGTAV